jgi:phospholipid/cholesterol/gamma-HCH transport system ATP-binding protein
MFLLEGKKLWEGTNDEITKSDVKELNDFVFATQLMKQMYLR